MRAACCVGFAWYLVATPVWAQEAEETLEGAEGEAAAGEMEDPLAALAELGDALAEEAPEGGGSIRAKKEADMTRLKRLQDRRNLLAKVELVRPGTFPAVAVRVKVTKPAKEGVGKSLKRNVVLVVVPKLKVEGGEVVLADPATLLNAGTFYLQRGDKVVIRLGEKKGKVWQAEYIERK